MGTILVIYASDYGHTKRAAAEVALGAERVVGTGVRLRSAAQATREEVLDADGLILGSPVHMGSVHWELKRFIDETLSALWIQDLMVGRVGGVFATGGGYGGAGGGCELAMLSILATLAELGMVIVPLPKCSESYEHGGLHWGPYARCGTDALAHTPPPAEHVPLLTAHGQNVARVATLLSPRHAGAKARALFSSPPL